MAASNTKSAFPSPDDLNNWLGGGLTMSQLNNWRAPEQTAMNQQWGQQQQKWLGITPPGATPIVAPPVALQQPRVPFHYVDREPIVTPPTNQLPADSGTTAPSQDTQSTGSLADLLKIILGQQGESSGAPSEEQFSISNNWAPFFNQG